MPFDGGLSPSTNRGVMPFYNVHTIQDVLDGRKYDDLHGGGSWSEGEDIDPSFREKGDDYKRVERDQEIINHMLPQGELYVEPQEKWKVKVPGGSRVFPSFYLAQKYKRELTDKGQAFVYVSRIAQAQLPEEHVPSTVDVVGGAINKTFMVESININEGVKETGSAFCVGPNLFATCAHVVKGYDKNLIGQEERVVDSNVRLLQNGQYYDATLVQEDLKLDIAILKSEVDIRPFELDTDIQVGEDIISIGSPHGYENNVSSGTLGSMGRRVYTHEGAPEYIFIDAAIFAGNSGGPIVKESNGKVVGMITLVISDGGDYGLNAGLPSKYIEEFLSKLGK